MIRDPNFKISTNFKFYELFKSSTAERLGINNADFITEDILERAVATAENILEPVRSRVGSLTPNSWFRSEPLEYAICAKSFFKKLVHQGIEGITESSYLHYARLEALPSEYRDHWVEYFSRKQHPKGEAVDFEKTGISNQVLFDWCLDNLQFDQLILEFHRPDQGDNSGWVHGSWNNSGVNRNQVLRY